MAKIRINECSYDEMLSLTDPGLRLRSARRLWIVREEKGNLKPIDVEYLLGITSMQNLAGLLDFSPCRVRNGERRGKTYAYREETLDMGTGRHVSWLARGHLAAPQGSGHANLLSKYRSRPTENIWKETSVDGKYREANYGEYWGCTAGVGQENKGSRDYGECNIPEIDTSDSPDIPRRKRREINIKAEVEVRVERESWDQRHSRDMGMGQESGNHRDYKGHSNLMNRETGGGSGQYGIQVEGRKRGTEVENWDQFQRTEIRGGRSELKGLISDSAKTLLIMNKEFKNTPDRVSRSPTQSRGVIQAGNSHEKEASPTLTNGPSVVTEVKDGGSLPITKMEGSTRRSSSLERNSESSRNGEGSHSEMGRENSMICRAKTYGNSFTEEGQKEKMEGSGTFSTAGEQEPLKWGCTPPEECVDPQKGENYGDGFTGKGQ